MHLAKDIGVLLLAAVLLPLLVVWIVVWLSWEFAWGGVLRVWFWSAHALHGRFILFVYSESPNWQPYIEENILPRIRNHAVVLNWSERQTWPSTSPWEARFFHRFSGHREFNPMALILCRNGRLKEVRFYRAFLDFKHGKEAALHRAEADLFALVEAAA